MADYYCYWKNGKRYSVPKKKQYAQSDEWKDRQIKQTEEQSTVLNQESKLQDELKVKKKKQQRIDSINKQLKECEDVFNDQYSSPYLREKYQKKYNKLRAELRKLEED